jgi:hypothetical protein
LLLAFLDFLGEKVMSRRKKKKVSIEASRQTGNGEMCKNHY